MLKIMEDYVGQLEALHADIRRAIAGLPQAALDWAPGPDMNSPVVLVVHLAGAERFWIGNIAMQDPAPRDRDAEFRAKGLDEATLRRRLADNITYYRRVLPDLQLDDLRAERVSPRDGNSYTVYWALNHALEHTALHTGHIELTRQLWEMQNTHR